VAQQVLIDGDVVAEDFALEPGAPVALAVKERIEGFVWCFAATVAAEAGITITDAGLPW